MYFGESVNISTMVDNEYKFLKELSLDYINESFADVLEKIKTAFINFYNSIKRVITKINTWIKNRKVEDLSKSLNKIKSEVNLSEVDNATVDDSFEESYLIEASISDKVASILDKFKKDKSITFKSYLDAYKHLFNKNSKVIEYIQKIYSEDKSFIDSILIDGHLSDKALADIMFITDHYEYKEGKIEFNELSIKSVDTDNMKRSDYMNKVCTTSQDHIEAQKILSTKQVDIMNLMNKCVQVMNSVKSINDENRSSLIALQEMYKVCSENYKYILQLQNNMIKDINSISNLNNQLLKTMKFQTV